MINLKLASWRFCCQVLEALHKCIEYTGNAGDFQSFVEIVCPGVSSMMLEVSCV